MDFCFSLRDSGFRSYGHVILAISSCAFLIVFFHVASCLDFFILLWISGFLGCFYGCFGRGPWVGFGVVSCLHLGVVLTLYAASVRFVVYDCR
jgi:hypothetical protein